MTTTLQNVIDRITLDHLNRSDLVAESVRAVKAAIRFYERERFAWNEAITTLTATVSQNYITVPNDFLVLDVLQVNFQSATYALSRRSFAEILEMNVVTGVNNLPTDFAERADRFYIHSVPDSAYLLPCYYLAKLPELTSTSMTANNKWLSAAEDVIVYHASKLVWANTLRNNDEATKMYALEQSSMKELRAYRDQRIISGIRATQF